VTGRLGLALAVVALLAWGRPVRAQPDRNYQGGCTDAGCHDQFTRQAVVHFPVSDNGCDSCHEASGVPKHQFKLTAEGAALCTDCHDAHQGRIRHSPVADGDCTTCHDPHASAAKGLLTDKNEAAVCGQCHDDVLEGLKFLHGPIGAGACSPCHDPHASDRAKLLRAEGAELCVKCHEGVRERIAGKKYVHEAVKAGCGSCHAPHGGGNAMFLTAPAPALCVDCHDAVGELIAGARVKHAPMTDAQSCTRCHDAHGSDHPGVLVNDSMPLCLSCHNQELKSADRTIANIAEELKNNPVHHGPIAQNNCGDCHAAHGGNVAHLLGGAYPASFYTAYAEDAYALCFNCHDAEAFDSADTDDATGFRNGRQNLHYVHVNRNPKGRTCRACHVIHAGKKPKLIAESVPFGEWSLPINFEPTDTGGACQPGCHKPYRYDRTEAVANLQP